MRTNQPHCCGEHCVCPNHGTALTYCPGTDEHACQDTACEHAHGIDLREGFWAIRH